MQRWLHSLRSRLVQSKAQKPFKHRLNLELLEDRRVLTAPSFANLMITSPINENGVATLTGLIVDPDVGETHNVMVNWGDGSPTDSFNFNAGEFVLNFLHQYLDNNTPPGPFNVSLIVTDAAMETGNGNVMVTVNNVSPTLGSLAATAIDENGTTTLTGVITDPGSLDSFTLAVNWGDGSPVDNFTFAAGTTNFDVVHQYLDNNTIATFPIGLTVTDKDGGVGNGMTTVAVTNVNPSFTGLSTTAIAENGTTTLAGFIVDPGSLDTFTVLVNWGDGTAAETYTFDAGTSAFDLEHQYLDNNTTATFPIALTVTDKDNGTGNGNTTVAVTNVNPSFTGLAATPVGENGVSTLSGFFVDPGSLDSFTLLVNWGDGTAPDTFTFDAGTTAFDVEHQYLDDDPSVTTQDTYDITLTVTDKDNGVGNGASQATVSNVAPTLTGLSMTNVDENGTSELAGFIVDPSVEDTFTIMVNWGDGSPVESFDFDAGTTDFSLVHQYLDNPTGQPVGNFTANLTVTDDDSGSSTGSIAVTVSNVAPTLTGLSATTPIAEGSVSTLEGFIVDQGTLDNFILVINWGDGTTADTIPLPAGTTGFSAVHRYADNGQFTANLSVTDKDGGNGTGSTAVTVNNVTPVVTLNGPTSIIPGTPYTLNLTYNDPGADTIVSTVVAWGDGSTDVLAGRPAAATHVYRRINARYTISATVTDEDGTFAAANTIPVLAKFSNDNQAFVAQMYSDLLLREVDPSGLGFFTGLLALGSTRVQVAASLEASTEYRTLFIRAQYATYLMRDADPTGLNDFLAFIAQGGTFLQVRSLLVGSQEYFVKNGSTNSSFLNALYRDALNRAPDPGAINSFLPALNAGVSRTQIGATIFGSAEFLGNLVNSEYNRYLLRNSDPGGFNYWLDFLQRGNREELFTASLVGSQEYFDNRIVR